ncbi:RNA methyltransferase [uncultured Gemmiger sp.]|uniref:TrmH family RNA methyltransferase n=1 Tax=uncultured Gemmiger sp. TaxID=1623490 RepID=UPI0025EC6EF2|nr:RNA methyltransferase [uncultured Gemmiger sp.]
MPQIIELQSLDLPGLEVFTRLTDTRLRARAEPEQGIFIAESPKVIAAALDAGYQPVSLLMERRQIEGPARGILARVGQQVPVYTGDRALLASLTGYTLTRGVLCAMHRRPLPRAEDICRDARRVAVLENIVDTTNVGAIFRSAAALGVDAVLLTPSCCDPLGRRAIRVSMGTVFQMPWTRLGTRASQWPEPGMAWLRQMGFTTVAMALSDQSLSLRDPRLPGMEKLAILLGSEGDGLTRETIAACDYTVRIPMAHGVDSLNVAAASAVAFWQLCGPES